MTVIGKALCVRQPTLCSRLGYKCMLRSTRVRFLPTAAALLRKDVTTKSKDTSIDYLLVLLQSIISRSDALANSAARAVVHHVISPRGSSVRGVRAVDEPLKDIKNSRTVIRFCTVLFDYS